MKQLVRAALWFLATALLVYALLMALIVAAILASGDGISCRGDSDCGAVSEWVGDAHPAPILMAIGMAVVIGVVVARRQTRS